MQYMSIKREDIEHLASLSRIRLTEGELTELEGELSTIVEYVSVVSEIAAADEDQKPQVGARHNVFRDDVVKNEPDQFTDAALKEMPKTNGRFMSVKKILDTSQ